MQSPRRTTRTTKDNPGWKSNGEMATGDPIGIIRRTFRGPLFVLRNHFCNSLNWLTFQQFSLSLYIYIYVYMHVYIYAYMYICIHMYACIYNYMYCIYTLIYIYNIYIYIHICIYTYTCYEHVLSLLSICACVISFLSYLCIHTCIHTYIHTYIYIERERDR